MKRNPVFVEKVEMTLLANVPESMAKDLKKKLIDEDISYKGWLVRQIEAYLKKGGDKNESRHLCP